MITNRKIIKNRERSETMILDYGKIKLACARKCLTIRNVLQEAHVSTLTAKRIKDGGEVNTKTAGKLAAALGVDVIELLADG